MTSLTLFASLLKAFCTKRTFGTFVATAACMAAQLTIPVTPIRKKRIVVTQHDQKRSLRKIFGVCSVVLAVLLVGLSVPAAISTYNTYTDFAQLIDQQINGGYLRSHAGLYAAPRVLETGARLSQDQLILSLQRAGYARDAASNIWSGSFQVNGNRVRVLPRTEAGSHEWVDVTFDQRGYVASISANDNTKLGSFSLEPELLTADAGLKTGHQETLTYNQIPPVLVQAILAIEDRRFFQHSGIDFRGVARAFASWISSGSVKFQQGGSTITQQLVKNTYLTPEKTLRRKFNEALIAVALEQRLSKQDILALYCNEVYLGQRDGVGVRGVAQAARVFFGKDLKNITPAEAATIAGMIQSPARYAPDRHPDLARQRRDQVIAAMVDAGTIEPGNAKNETSAPIATATFESDTNEFAPYYVDAVNRAIENAQHGIETDEQNLRVQTTIDPDLQAGAEAALRHQLDLLSKANHGKATPQGALVAIDVHNGHVLAMVGGRNYAESQLNRATDAKRQPGSVFKPFVYAAAFDSGISPLSIYKDAPQTFRYGTATYSPANFGNSYSMHDVLLREGLVRSLNVVTVQLALQTGLSKVANTAARFGLPMPDSYPSMALGTFEATPLQLAAAYGAFANGGRLIEPTVFAGAVDNTGEPSLQPTFASRQVISPGTAYMITDALEDVIKRGTARRAKDSLGKIAIAGKTGTSRDGWFVGYTPNVVCAVWIGFDDNAQLGMTGAEAALPAWVDFMKSAVAIRPSLGGTSFTRPSDIIAVKIDPESGALAGPSCPTSQIVRISYRFAPQLECTMHLPPTEYELSEMDGDTPSDTDVDGSADHQLPEASPPAADTLPPVVKPIPGQPRTRVESDQRILLPRN